MTGVTARYDVVITGGGPAGLTLAMQLRQERPDTSILVVERSAEPPPDATHKVGESTVEISAHYLRDVLGLGEHLRSGQLRKFGLRVFFSEGDNRDITRRVELGHAAFPQAGVGTYQLDRGRFETALADMLPERGIEFRRGVRVDDVELRPDADRHVVRLSDAGGTSTVEARWVVDATGRSSLLKRRLGLRRAVDHTANAVWFRIGSPMDIDEWSDDPGWRERIREGQRRLSTNHLVGPGYWVWLIPLSSDAISVGIVTDPRQHPFGGMNRFDRAMAWLERWEPQCAEQVRRVSDRLLDFRTVRNYAYSSEQVYSSQRWALAGEAAVFLDPLYSPGLDLIAVSNLLITDMVRRDLDGEDVEELAAIHNQAFFLLFDGWMSVYENQYPVFGNAKCGLAKVVWDTAAYWAVPGLLYFQKTLTTLVEHPSIMMGLARFSTTSRLVQRFLREWVAVETSRDRGAFVGFYDFAFMRDLHIGMTAELGSDEMDARFAANVALIDRLSGRLVRSVLADLEADTADEAKQEQVRAWRADDDLMRLVRVADAADADGVDDGAEWDPLDRLAAAR